jgi:4-amino-4-deoxy-L-arabinose transferase-like glycosyltransferase
MDSHGRERMWGVLDRAETFIRLLLAEPPRARRVYPWVLLLFTLIIWFPTLFTGLDLANPDDFYHTTQAALHHTPRDILGWFTRGYWAYTHLEYRPLTRLSLLANYFVFGPRPWGFHLVNVLLHFGCAFLLVAALTKAGAPVWAARLSGGVAVVFPPGQMAVSWINGRQDLLCGFLLLAALCLWLDWVAGKSWARLLGAAACSLLSALAKEPGAVAPAVFLASAFIIPSRRAIVPRLGAVGLVALVLAPYVVLRLRAWPMGDYAAQNALQLRPLSVSITWLLSDVLVPRLYEVATTWRQQGLLIFFSPRFPRLLIEQIAFWVGLAILVKRQPRLLALGVAWEVLLFLPVHNLYWNPAFTHYRYLPHLGTAALVGVAAWELAGWAAARMHGWGRPAIRWSLIALGLALLVRFYIGQLDFRWPPWWLIRQGGPKPPATFGRSLTGPGKPRFDESAIYAPGERPATRF